MNDFPVYINLTLYSPFYDIMYFYISTYNSMMASNNSDTARSTKEIFLIFSQNGCADIILNENEVKIFFTLCKMFKIVCKTFIYQTNIAETFINA